VPFGGYSVLMFGDCGQLFPVQDIALYLKNDSEGYQLYVEQFRTVVSLKTNYRAKYDGAHVFILEGMRTKEGLESARATLDSMYGRQFNDDNRIVFNTTV